MQQLLIIMKESNTYFAVQTSHWQVKDFLRNLYTIWALTLRKDPQPCSKK